MSASKVEVSLKALTELKSKLLQLSGSLHEINGFMNADLSEIANSWDDGKYEEFKEAYSDEVKECDDIANAYEEWCKGAIDPLTEGVETITNTQVTPNGGGASSGGGGAAAGAGAAGSAGVATSGAKTGMASKFNTGKEASGRNITVQARSNAASQNTPSKGSAIDPKVAQEKKSSVGGDAAKQISDAADVLCSNPKVKKSKLSVEEVSDSGNWGLDGNVGGGAKMKGIFDVSAKMGGFFNSGKKTTKVKIEDAEIDCTQQ